MFKLSEKRAYAVKSAHLGVREKRRGNARKQRPEEFEESTKTGKRTLLRHRGCASYQRFHVCPRDSVHFTRTRAMSPRLFTAVLFLASFAVASFIVQPAAAQLSDGVSIGLEEPAPILSEVTFDPEAQAVQHVIHISVDGLRPDAVTRQGPGKLPNFFRLRTEGAFTDNARTDADFSITLPNHMAQLTGRPALGDAGHNWTENSDPGDDETLHARKGAYVASVFDVTHDHGLRTGVYASKSKFILLDQSYGEAHGAPDVTGEDNGRDKIDVFVYDKNTDDLVERFVDDMREEPLAYTFLHLRDPDTQGHRWGWGLSGWHPYMGAVRKVDQLLGEIFEMVEEDPHLAESTVIILTADHGGSGHHHKRQDAEHYTIPFYVWGAGVDAGDLYALNDGVFVEPRTHHPGFDWPSQPIRNGSVANLALGLLGMDPVPGSTINESHQMRVMPLEPAELIEPVNITDAAARDARGERNDERGL